MYGIPNCVPEFYRSMWEDEAHEAEKELERQNWYEKNKAYQDKRYHEGCWLVSFYPDECENCEHGEEGMPTAEWDDVPTKICDNWRNCPVFKKYVEEHWPNVPYEEVCSWHDENNGNGE